MDKLAMYENLLTFKRIMDKNGIPFVFIFGGLLGLIRGGDLIDYDTDVDFACFGEYHTKMAPVVKEMRENGFNVLDRDICPLHDHFMIRNGEKIELWWFDRIGDKRIYDYKVQYDRRFFDVLEEVTFLGVKWKVPFNPKKFLEITYGPTWVTPNPNGSYILGRDAK